MKRLGAAVLVALVLLCSGLATATLVPATQDEAAGTAAAETFAAILSGRGDDFAARSPGEWPANTRVEIRIDRWSEPDQRSVLLDALEEGGSRAFVDALRAGAPIGSLRIGRRQGYPISHARQIVKEDGGRGIELLVDTRVSDLEAMGERSRAEYAVSLFDIHVGANNEGSGTIVVGTNVSFDAESEVLKIGGEDSTTLRLGSVRRRR